MNMLSALIKSIAEGSSNDPKAWPKGNDMRMEVPPMDESTAAGKIMHPDQMMTQMQKPPPGTISDDSGKLVDFNFDSNPFKKIIDSLPGGGQGTMTGMLKNLFGSEPMPQQKLMDKSGVTPRIGGTGDPNHVSGTGEDAVLSRTPIKDQRQRSMAAPPPPPDYSMPTALDPQSIEELRQSLMTQSGMMDPANPNSLPARMSGPYSQHDMKSQADEANAISDAVRGPYEESRADRRNTKGTPRSSAPASTVYTEQKAPPRWSDYAKEAVATNGSVNPIANAMRGTTTSEGLVELIMGLEPGVQVLRGAKDVLDKLGITTPLRRYRSKIGNTPEDKA